MKKKNDNCDKIIIASVTWGDAWFSETTKNREAIIEDTSVPLELCTVGFVINDDENGMTLGLEYCRDFDSIRYYQFIPRAMVREVKILDFYEKEKK